MNEEAALLKAICTQPDDDTPRLVYADWLDEQGGVKDRARATFIRAQVEHAQLPLAHHFLSAERSVPFQTSHGCPCRSCELVRVAKKVFHNGWLRKSVRVIYKNCPVVRPRGSLTGECILPDGSECRFWFVRGMVGGFRSRAAEFVARAGAVFAAHPIEQVDLDGCEPTARTNSAEWLRAAPGQEVGGSVLPADIFDLLPDHDPAGRRLVLDRDSSRASFDRPTEARTACELACLAYGRRERDRLLNLPVAA